MDSGGSIRRGFTSNPASKKNIWILVLLCVVLLGSCWLLRGYFTVTPFALRHTLNGPSGVFPGAEGRVYLIDGGKTQVLLVGASGALTSIISCGIDSDDSPFYASLVAEGADGSIYVADVRYVGEGTRISQERIFRYDRGGKHGKLLYTITYDKFEDMSLQYGNILSMREEQGFLLLSLRTRKGLAVLSMSPETGETQRRDYPIPGLFISDADVTPDTHLPVFTNRTGQLYAVESDGLTRVLVGEGRTSWMLCADGAAVYYTDLASFAVLRLDLSTGAEKVVLQGENIIYTVQTQGETLCATDYVGYFQMRGGEMSYVDTLPYSVPILRRALWASLFLGIAAGLAALCLGLIRSLKGRPRSETFQRIVTVLCVALCVGGLVMYMLIGVMVDTQKETVLRELNLFGDILVQATDVEALSTLDSLEDYQDETYLRVKEPLDTLTAMAYGNGTYYYYAIYATDGETIFGVMDYEETCTARHPFFPYGTPGYTEVFSEGAVQEVSGETSSYGSWSFVIKPIFNREGIPVAGIEVGINLDAQNEQLRQLIVKLMLLVFSTVVVLIMLIIEIILYLPHQKTAPLPVPEARGFPLRAIIFLTFLADCMQDAFISIRANQLYTPMLGIPQSVGAALPLSAQVLCCALSAFGSGFLARRIGVKKNLLLGFAIQISGFLLCAAVPTYLCLLGGKCLIGLGMGLILVGCNSVAASGHDQDETARAFAAVSAGTLAGVTAGVGFGSIVLSFGGASLVYFIGAALLLLLALPIVLHCDDFREKPPEKGVKSVRLSRFLWDRETLSFLALLLTPFLMALSFREYFFPLFATEAGLSETDIGQIYLVCGLLIIYAGPMLTAKLIQRVGGKWTAVLASLLIALATLLFVFNPTLEAAVAGVVIISVTISFGYAAQSTYYARLPGVNQYGGSRAMGVYSLFDNGGQTLGPVIYGLAMLAGYRTGLLLIGVGILVLLVLFLLLSGGRSRSRHNYQEVK